MLRDGALTAGRNRRRHRCLHQLCELGRRGRARLVVDVEHRRLDVGMTHVALHVMERPCLDCQRAERVAQIVEDERVGLAAQVPEASRVERFVERIADRGVVPVLASLRAEHESRTALACPVFTGRFGALRCAQFRSKCAFRDTVRDTSRLDSVAVRPHRSASHRSDGAVRGVSAT
jgi:hypothetical protein